MRKGATGGDEGSRGNDMRAGLDETGGLRGNVDREKKKKQVYDFLFCFPEDGGGLFPSMGRREERSGLVCRRFWVDIFDRPSCMYVRT